MGRRGRYTVQFRRRREGRTDYRKRIALLKSGKPMLIVRKSNKYVFGQIALFDLKGDKIIVHAHSNELKKFGWPFALKNLPAAYLTGLLLGVRAKKAGYEIAIPNLGMQRKAMKGILFAFLKGAKDAGLQVPLGEEAIPDESRIKGEHIAAYFKQNRNHFKGYESSGIDATQMPQIFEQVKEKILKE